MTASPDPLLAFWFGPDLASAEAVAARAGVWFASDPAFDEELRRRFGSLPAQAMRGDLDAWRSDARSCLALVLALDQLPRNLHRGTAEGFACDARARDVAEAALARGFDRAVHPVEASFYYLPLEHAEDLLAQERCVALFEGLAQRAPAALRAQCNSFHAYAVRHRDVVARFGRFPHRNALLGRSSTDEERAYLEDGGEDFGASAG